MRSLAEMPPFLCKRINLAQKSKCLRGVHKIRKSYENNVSIKEVSQIPTFFVAGSLAP